MTPLLKTLLGKSIKKLSGWDNSLLPKLGTASDLSLGDNGKGLTENYMSALSELVDLHLGGRVSTTSLSVFTSYVVTRTGLRKEDVDWFVELKIAAHELAAVVSRVEANHD